MREQYAKYDDALRKDPFLDRHYECLPYIGEKYEPARLLLVGDSHYVPKDAVNCVDRDDFYDTSFDELADGEYKCWIDTRCVFEYRAYGTEHFESFFANMAAEISKVIYDTPTPSLEQKRAALQHFAFMNYYKRPSCRSGKTIEELTEEDNKYAYSVSSHIINVLNPKHIIFVSRKAYDAFCDEDKDEAIRSRFPVKCVSHPSSYWWNRPRTDGHTAKEDFHEYVKEVLLA